MMSDLIISPFQVSFVTGAKRVTRWLYDAAASDVKVRIFVIYGVLAILNAGVWLWALAVFHNKPALLAVAFMICGLGLRHAVDADQSRLAKGPAQ